MKKNRKNWIPIEGKPLTELDERVLSFQEKGYLVPSRNLIKNEEQIKGIKESGIINTGVLDLISKEIKEGMTTLAIDQLVYDFTMSHGAIPAPLNYSGFPKSCCTSINEVVCHGIPNSKTILKEGDIINVDVSTILNGYFSDASRMFCIGEISQQKKDLVRVARECLVIGMKAAKPYGFVGDIGAAIEPYAVANGFSVVRDLCGHGVGLKFHEEPEIPHFQERDPGMLLVPGMVFTIEPMINMGKYKVCFSRTDGWTVTTQDKKPSAQWEHTLLMTEKGVEIVTY